MISLSWSIWFTPSTLAKHVCTTCGIKRHFGYVYHRPGQVYDRKEGSAIRHQRA